MIQAIIRAPTTKERRSKLLHSISTLDHFKGSLLHRVIQYLSNHEVQFYLSFELITSVSDKTI